MGIWVNTFYLSPFTHFLIPPSTHQLYELYKQYKLNYDEINPENPMKIRASRPAVIKVKDAPLNTLGISTY